jgi:hypothetical protein
MTTMHRNMFDQITPTAEQQATLADMRVAALNYADAIEEFVPDGPDKTYILRSLRSIAMWVSTAIVRRPDGSPRE